MNAQVSGLLEAGKSFFIDAATAFEERIVQYPFQLPLPLNLRFVLVYDINGGR